MDIKKLLLIAVLFCQIAKAQPFIFERIGTDNGLSHSFLMCAAQDKYGFLWFGTEDGLNRYDGYNFDIYRPQPNEPNSITSRYIEDILADSSGLIWIQHKGGGLSIYNPITEKFIKPRHNANYNSISNNQINTLYADKNQNIWISTINGLNKYNRENNTFSRYLYTAIPADSNNIQSVCRDTLNTMWIGTVKGLYSINLSNNKQTKYTTENNNQLFSNEISYVFVDKKNRVWINCKNYGLCLLTTKNKVTTIERIEICSKKPWLNTRNNVYKIIETRNGNLWFATNKGVAYINANNSLKEITHYIEDIAFANPVNEIPIRFIIEDSKGVIWTSSTFSTLGLGRYNSVLNKFEFIKSESYNLQTLSNNICNNVIEDRSGNLWVLHVKGGLSKLNLYPKAFRTYSNNQEYSKSSYNNGIYSIYQDKGGVLWLGTQDGLIRLNRNKNEIKRISSNKVNGSGNLIGVIQPDTRGFLWIGYYDALLAQFNTQTGKYKFYNYNPNQTKSSICWSVRAILPDKHNNVWIASYSAGLTKLAPNLESFTYYLPGSSRWYNIFQEKSVGKISDYETTSLLLTNNDSVLWIGTVTGGLNKYNILTNTFTNFLHSETISNTISSNEIYCLHQSGDKNTIWIGTGGGGLNKFNFSKNTFTYYTTKNGLAGNTIYGILEDKKGQLWLSTNSGLSKFNPLNGSCQNYHEEDGLSGNEFNQGAYFVNNKTDEHFFGSIKGLVSFFPDSIKNNPFSPTLLLNKFRLFNNIVLPGDTIDDCVVLQKSIVVSEQIVLNHKQNDFSFEFAALHYTAPSLIKYRYQLIGYDKTWKYTNAQNRIATYTRIKYGNYKFIVEATNNDGIWSKQTAQINLILLPPWWQAWWFKVILWIGLIIFIYVFYIIRVQRLQRRTILLEEKVSMRTIDLMQTKQQLENQQQEVINQNILLSDKNEELEVQKLAIENYSKKLHEADQAKLRFFTNISHEFKTPLTLISAPLEKINIMPDEIQLKQAKPIINLILKHTNRLQKLVNQLLDFRKLDNNVVKISVEPFNLPEFVVDIAFSFSALTEKHNQHIEIVNLTQAGDYWADKEIIEKVVYNLISNAVKYSENGSKIVVTISKEEVTSELQPEYLKINIADNGKGIAPTEQVHIFERFYQTSNSVKEGQHGSGIGLALSKELIELHKGEIGFTSTLNVGSNFFIKIPVNPESYTDDEIRIVEKEEIIISEENHFDNFLPSELVKNDDSPTLLLAEDEIDLLNFLSNELNSTYNIKTASNGKIALELALEIQPDLIISDIMMPEMNGLELCNHIKTNSITSHIPVILLTARNTIEHEAEGLETGADDYISKPFSIQLLRLRIRNLINARNTLREKFASNPNITTKELALNIVDATFINNVMQIVHQNIANTEFDADTIAVYLNMSKVHLYRKIKAITNLSVNIFVRNERLKTAADLLLKSPNNINEIAWQVGFSDPNYFIRCFSEFYGVSPKKYRG